GGEGEARQGREGEAVNQVQIVLRIGPVDPKWYAEQKYKQCAHFHDLKVGDIVLWSDVPYLGPWCGKCDLEVARIGVQREATRIEASLADGAMEQLAAYFEKGGRTR